MGGSRFFLLLTTFVCFLRLSQSQELQCGDLNVEYAGRAVPGTELNVCRATSLQCCSQDYIDRVTRVASSTLSLEIRNQLRNTGVVFNRTISLTRSYFENDFVSAFIQILSSLLQFGGVRIDFSTLQNIVGAIIERIPENIVIDDSTRNFNITQFAVDVVTALGEAAGRALTTNVTSRACVLNAIRSNINQTDIALITNAIERMRRSFTVLNSTANFLYRYAATTQFQFPSNCLRRFVELNFCARCTKRIPPLCSNTCGALIRGCLSSYYSALARQFNILWNVSRQVLRISNETLQAVFNEERQLIDATAAITSVIRCPGIRLPLPIGKRQTGGESGRAAFIPFERMQELRNLSGVAFRYARDNSSNYLGPIACRPSAREIFFCNRDGTPSRTQNCSSGEACTSSCRCFDGKNEQMDNTEEFNVDGIEGQENNPAIDLDTNELVEIATSVGMPVSAFLMQADVASFIPDGVEVPTSEPFGTGGGATTLVSTTVLLLGAVAVFVLS